MAKLSRTKGRAFEQDLARRLREAMPDVVVRRGLQTRDGAECPDVDCPVFWIEAKCGKRPNVRAALTQAGKAAPKGRIPLAVIREDRRPIYVALLLDDWLEIVAEWWQRRER